MISAKRDKTEKNTQRRKQNRISVKEKLITMLKKNSKNAVCYQGTLVLK